MVFKSTTRGFATLVFPSLAVLLANINTQKDMDGWSTYSNKVPATLDVHGQVLPVFSTCLERHVIDRTAHSPPAL